MNTTVRMVTGLPSMLVAVVLKFSVTFDPGGMYRFIDSVRVAARAGKPINRPVKTMVRNVRTRAPPFGCGL